MELTTDSFLNRGNIFKFTVGGQILFLFSISLWFLVAFPSILEYVFEGLESSVHVHMYALAWHEDFSVMESI